MCVEVEQEDPHALSSEAGPEVERGRGLSDAALLIHDRIASSGTDPRESHDIRDLLWAVDAVILPIPMDRIDLSLPLPGQKGAFRNPGDGCNLGRGIALCHGPSSAPKQEEAQNPTQRLLSP